MAIPVLISKAVNRYNDKPCSGAEAYCLYRCAFIHQIKTLLIITRVKY